MDRVVDFTDDNLRLLINSGIKMPDFVKASSTDEIRQPTRYCALPGVGLFPCHTKAACWISHVYYYRQKDSLAPAEQQVAESNLTKWADYWSFSSEDVKAALDEAAPDPDDDDFALILTQGADRKLRVWPLVSDDQIKTAAAEFAASRERLPLQYRRAAATAILKKADAASVRLQEHEQLCLERSAGYGISDVHKAASYLTRLSTVPVLSDDERTSLQKLAQALENIKPSAKLMSRLVKIADAVCSKYDCYLQKLPEDELHSLTYSIAKSAQDRFVTFSNGQTYDIADLVNVPANLWKQVPAIANTLATHVDKKAAFDHMKDAPVDVSNFVTMLLRDSNVTAIA